MIEKLTGRYLVGVVRAIKGMPSVADQTEALLAAGVIERHIWQLDKDEVSDVVRDCRPGNDVLVVPFLGVLGKYRHDLLAGIAEKGAELYDLDEHGLMNISQAPTFAIIDAACKVAQSAPGRASGAGQGGRKKKLTPAQEREVHADYIGTKYKTISAICDKYGVSVAWLHSRWGGRQEAREAAKRGDD